MALYKIFSSRVNNIDADQYAGSVVEQGLIWYDPDTGILRLYNGLPGGQIINGSGNVSSQLVNGTSNVVVYPNGNVAISVNGTANVAVFSNPVASFGNLIASGNITANEFIGNGSGLTDVTASQVGVLPNLSVSGTVTSGESVVAGNVLATGNITGDYLFGNGAFLTGIAGGYGNANVAAYLPTYTGNLSAGNATVAGTLFVPSIDTDDSSALEIVPAANFLSSLQVDDSLTVGGNITAAWGNITGLNLSATGALITPVILTDDSSALTIASPLIAQASVTVDDALTVGGNVTATQITAVGNVAATYFIGNGSLLTGIASANGLPSQAGQAGKYLTTDGATATWNDALGASLTFDGGGALAVAAAELVGGNAANTQTNSIEGGAAISSYDLTLSSVALTGQYEDLIDQDVSIPATPTSAGSLGQIAFDTSWVYICVASNVWRRASLQTW